jgi:SAM-dependent methyltransferase
MCCNGLIILIALILGFAAAIYLVYQAYSYIRCGCGKYGPFVSSYGKIKEDILDEARTILKKSKKSLKITDLGCGSGALLLPLAKEFPNHKFIGLEWDIVPLTMGKIKAKMAGLNNITFVKGNYMKESHADMDLIMCYVLKVTGEPLGKKLAKEIKETAVVISEMFPLGHLEEVKQIDSSLAGIPEKIFVYKKPAVKAKKETIKATSKTALQAKEKKSAKAKVTGMKITKVKTQTKSTKSQPKKLTSKTKK